MKKYVKIITIAAASLALSACALSVSPGSSPAPDAGASSEAVSESEPESSAMSEEDASDIAETEPAADEAVDEGMPDTGRKSRKKVQSIVWIGDSMTQGSLGHNNDNVANAPYVRLMALCGVPVEGVGLYGYNTHDIFWTYTDAGQLGRTVDKDKTYILWVGSNDWAQGGVGNTDTAKVIAEIDRFLNLEGPVKNYIVIGTTSRYELAGLYPVINKALSDHYGVHYLDVINAIGPNGYGPDGIHLTQAAYDSVAGAVYTKLKALGYI